MKRAGAYAWGSAAPITCHRHLTPWIAALYVVPESRHAGLAMQLVVKAEEWARRLGYGAVHIGISAARERYEERGWRFLGAGRAGEDTVTVLAKSWAAAR